MINRLRPDLLENAKEKPVESTIRPDVRRVDENIHQSAKDILIQKGILKEPTKPTVLLDQFTGTVPAQAEPQPEVLAKVTAETQTDLKGKQIEQNLDHDLPKGRSMEDMFDRDNRSKIGAP